MLRILGGGPDVVGDVIDQLLQCHDAVSVTVGSAVQALDEIVREDAVAAAPLFAFA
jgi:hypothetical protein